MSLENMENSVRGLKTHIEIEIRIETVLCDENTIFISLRRQVESTDRQTESNGTDGRSEVGMKNNNSSS